MPNPFSTTGPDQENPLTQERLHWGIIVSPALILGIFLLTLGLPVVLIMKFATDLFARLAPKAAGPSSTVLLWILLPGFVLFAMTLAITLVEYFTSEITLTDRRLVFRTGFLSRQSGELPLENVEAIFIQEPFLGRILGYGTVTVTGLGGITFPLNYIRSPRSFHATLQNAVNKTKNPRQSPPNIDNLPRDDSRYMPKR